MESEQKYHLLATSEKYDESQLLYTDNIDMEKDFLESHSSNDKFLSEKSMNNSTLSSKFSCISLFGILYAFLSCCFFATGSVFTKLCQGFLTAFQVTFIRCLMQLIFCIMFIAHNRLTVWKNLSNQTRLFLAIRGVFGGCALLLIFYSFQNMPLGDASAIVFSSSIYTVLLARFFLKEPFGLLEGIILVVTVIGVVLITRPTTLFSSQPFESDLSNEGNTTSLTKTMVDTQFKHQNIFLGTVAAIAASVMIACGHIALRNLPSVHFSLPLFYLSVCGVVVTSVSMLNNKVFLLPLEAKYWGYTVLIGLCGCIGQMFMTKAYQVEKAGAVAIIRQCDVVLAYIFQLTVFVESPSVASTIGAVLVVGGSLSLALKKMLTAKKP